MVQKKKKRRKKPVHEPVLTQRELKRAAGFRLSSAVIGDGRRHSYHCGAGLEHPWGFLHPADPVLAGPVGLNNPPPGVAMETKPFDGENLQHQELIRP